MAGYISDRLQYFISYALSCSISHPYCTRQATLASTDLLHDRIALWVIHWSIANELPNTEQAMLIWHSLMYMHDMPLKEQDTGYAPLAMITALFSLYEPWPILSYDLSYTEGQAWLKLHNGYSDRP